MEFYILKRIGYEPPDDFTNVYFKPNIELFLKYAATFIVEGSEYRLEGPDEHFKKELQDAIDRKGGCLEINYGKTDGNVHLYLSEWVPIKEDEPNLGKGLSSTIPIPGYSVVDGFSPVFFPVKNMKEAQVLRERYLADKAAKKNL